MLWAGTAGTDLFQLRRRSFGMVLVAGTPEIASVLFEQRDGPMWAGGTNVLRGSAASNKSGFDPVQAPLPARPVGPDQSRPVADAKL